VQHQIGKRADPGSCVGGGGRGAKTLVVVHSPNGKEKGTPAERPSVTQTGHEGEGGGVYNLEDSLLVGGGRKTRVRVLLGFSNLHVIEKREKGARPYHLMDPRRKNGRILYWGGGKDNPQLGKEDQGRVSPRCRSA